MHGRKLAGVFVVLCLLIMARGSSAADDATVFHVFLKDGRSLTSYGEFARVGDRVVFSMPTSASVNPSLQLVNIEASRVDWDRTNRYAASARSTHYLATQADNDYAALSNEIAQTLNDVALTTDPAKRLAIVERARQALADWPPNHFNYRAAEVRQMLGMLDDAIADLRASTGGERFALNLSAFAELPPIPEPLLPALTPQQAIEQTLLAAQLSDSAAERASLLTAALSSLERDSASLPAEWANTTRADTTSRINAEIATTRTYQGLTARMLSVAQARSKAADVRGLEHVLQQIHDRDAALGHARPDIVAGLIGAVETELDAARKLQLARDRFVLRSAAFAKYKVAIAAPIDLFARLTAPLEDIKALSGSSPAALSTVHRLVAQIVKSANAIAPPEELKAAHALLISAAQLADNAARIRLDATLAGDIARAWDASSAAAGALMLESRARTDMQALMRAPQRR
jgi:hypothetical protein